MVAPSDPVSTCWPTALFASNATDASTTQAPLLGHAPGTDLAAASGAEGQEEGEDDDETIDLRSVEGGVSAAAIRRLIAMVDTHPEDSINVLRSWIYEGTS